MDVLRKEHIVFVRKLIDRIILYMEGHKDAVLQTHVPVIESENDLNASSAGPLELQN